METMSPTQERITNLNTEGLRLVEEGLGRDGGAPASDILSKAVVILTESVLLMEEQFDAWFGLCRVYIALDDREKAKAIFWLLKRQSPADIRWLSLINEIEKRGW